MYERSQTNTGRPTDRSRYERKRSYVHISGGHKAVGAGSFATLDVYWLRDTHAAAAIGVSEVETDGVFLDRSARILHLHALLAARLLWVIDDYARSLHRQDNVGPSQSSPQLDTMQCESQ